MAIGEDRRSGTLVLRSGQQDPERHRHHDREHGRPEGERQVLFELRTQVGVPVERPLVLEDLVGALVVGVERDRADDHDDRGDEQPGVRLDQPDAGRQLVARRQRSTHRVASAAWISSTSATSTGTSCSWDVISGPPPIRWFRSRPQLRFVDGQLLVVLLGLAAQPLEHVGEAPRCRECPGTGPCRRRRPPDRRSTAASPRARRGAWRWARRWPLTDGTRLRQRRGGVGEVVIVDPADRALIGVEHEHPLLGRRVVQPSALHRGRCRR